MLQEWKEEGDKLILFIDSNENMEKGQLQQMLQNEGIDMRDVIKYKSKMPGPPTFVRDTRQIDAVQITKDIEIDAACFTPFYFGIGDHRGIIIDIPKTSLTGGENKNICRPTERKLQCNEEKVWRKYNERLESYFIRHRIQRKIETANIHNNDKIKLRKTMNKINQVITEGMINAEKKCRKIRAGMVPFSPIVAEAGTKVKLWSLIVRHHNGSNINTRYIRRIATKCKIKKALSNNYEVALRKLDEATKE